MQVIGARLAPITHGGKAHTQKDQTVHKVPKLNPRPNWGLQRDSRTAQLGNTPLMGVTEVTQEVNQVCVIN